MIEKIKLAFLDNQSFQPKYPRPPHIFYLVCIIITSSILLLNTCSEETITKPPPEPKPKPEINLSLAEEPL